MLFVMNVPFQEHIRVLGEHTRPHHSKSDQLTSDFIKLGLDAVKFNKPFKLDVDLWIYFSAGSPLAGALAAANLPCGSFRDTVILIMRDGDPLTPRNRQNYSQSRQTNPLFNAAITMATKTHLGQP